jgi:hypothetical protein
MPNPEEKSICEWCGAEYAWDGHVSHPHACPALGPGKERAFLRNLPPGQGVVIDRPGLRLQGYRRRPAAEDT